jgi:membrane-bound ClpP family serine protease
MSFLQAILLFFTDTTNPTLRLLQIVLLILGVLAAFLVFFTTRDVLLRSKSFVFQLFSIVLVAIVPLFGFLLYILIRPSRTLKERELEHMLQRLLERQSPPPATTSTPPVLIAQAPDTEEKKGKSKEKKEEK